MITNWRKPVKLAVTILILFGSSLIGLLMLPTTTVAADAGMATDMPVVYVNPQNITADPGETFTVSVKIFNLTDNFYTTDQQWVPGEPLGPTPGLRYNYSLGNLYGLDIQFSWDPTLLQYWYHNVTIPVEDHSEGVLHQPIFDLKDDVNPTAGTYWLAKSSQSPAAAFNSPAANATVFTMTFNVSKLGSCALTLDQVSLAVDAVQFPDASAEIPHWKMSSQFRTSILATRIENVVAGVSVAGSFFSPPLISGENATIEVAMKNEGELTDVYNLSLYRDTALLRTWENETLEASRNKTFSYTIDAGDLGVGSYKVTANAAISHGNTTILEEEAVQLKVVGTPVLEIKGPTSATSGDTVSFDASSSSHSDPNAQITNYTWTLWAPGETLPRYTKQGVAINFELPRKAKSGNWTVVLKVLDSNGLEYNPSRPATAPYREEMVLDVSPTGPSGIPYDIIALAVILVIIIAAAVIYLRRRSR